MGDGTNTISPEVFEKVSNEIKSYGEDTKKQYTELRKSHEELKSVVNDLSDDGLQKERVAKFTEDIITRQTALDELIVKSDKESTDRMDAIEVALKRTYNGGSGANDDASHKYALQHAIECAAVKMPEKGVTPDIKSRLEENLSIETYKNYRNAFDGFLRKWGGSPNHVATPEHIKALSVGVDPDGGYTVTPEMSSQIVKKLFENDPIRQLASTESITTGAIEWLVDWEDFGAGWEAETETGAETTTAQFKKKRIPVHVIYAKPHATQTLLEDSGINIENWISNKLGDKFLRFEGAAFVTGDGVGKPRGFLTYASGTNFGQVEQVNMGSAAAITADGLFDVKFSLEERYLNRASWLLNRLTVSELLQLKNGAGDYIWKPGLSEREPATILGLPYKMSTTMPTIAANSLSVALADWREAYMVVDRLGVTIQRDPFTATPFIKFYARKRVGGDVIGYSAIKIGKIAV